MRGSLTTVLLLIFSAGLLASAAPFSSTNLDASYDSCRWLYGAPLYYKVYWSVNATHLRMALQANTTGWIGIGISADGSMHNNYKGSDIYVAYNWANGTNSNRTPHVYDYWTTEHDLPKKDGSQDISLLNFESSNNGISTYEIVRKLATGDAADTDISPTARTYLIWASSPQLPVSSDGSPFRKHSLRGSVGPFMWNHKSKCSVNPPNEGVGANDTKTWTNGPGTWRMRWEIDYDSDEIEVEMSAKTEGWVAIGMTDTPHMPNSDVIIGWREAGGENRIIDGWAGAVRVMPKPDVEVGGDDDVRLISLEQVRDNSSDIWTVVRWRRKLFTPDVHDMDIENRDIYVLWAYGRLPGQGTQYDLHYDRGIVSMNLATTKLNETVRIDGRSRHTPRRTAHAIMMVVSWAGLITPGNFIARFVKPLSHRWFPVHVGFQLAGVILSTVAWILMSYDLGFRNDHFFSLHGVLGLLLMLASYIQVILGFVAHLLFNPNRSQPPFLPDRFHWYMGRTIQVLSAGNIFLGMWRYRLIFYHTRHDPYLELISQIGTAAALIFGLWCVLAFCSFSLAETRPARNPDRSVWRLLKDPSFEDHVEAEQADPSKVMLALHFDQQDSPRVSVQSRSYSIGEAIKRNTTLIGVFIVHFFLLAFVVVILAQIPSDEERTPFQFCSNCTNLELRFRNYTVPVGLHFPKLGAEIENSTSYVCRGFDIGNSETWDMVEIDPLVDNPDIVHHMILYSIPWNAVNDGYFDCIDMPASAFAIWAWAPGIGTFRTPAEAGIRVGKDSDIRYLVLQIHYDNPTLDSNRVDSTGVRVRMTNELRAHDAGFLFTGVHTNKIVIPANTPQWEISGNCSSADTQLLPFNLNVFAVATHAHLTGRMVWTEIWRNGKFVELLTPDWAYDFSDQKMVRVTKTIRPGDELITHCVYDTIGKAAPIVGGDATTNEMCLSGIVYWPKVDAAACFSDPTVWGRKPSPTRPDRLTTAGTKA